jgi:hypothetical protein
MSTVMQKPDSAPHAPLPPPLLPTASSAVSALSALGAEPTVGAEQPATAPRTAVAAAMSHRFVGETAVDRRRTATADDHDEIGGL